MENDYSEIGKLVKEIIILSTTKKQGKDKQQNDIHYLQRLIQEPPESVKLIRSLKNKIITHPVIMGTVSEKVIGSELFWLLTQDKYRKNFLNMESEVIGKKLIDDVIRQKHTKFISFILRGFYVTPEMDDLCGVNLDILKNLLVKYNIQPIDKAKIEIKSDWQRAMYDNAYEYEMNSYNTFSVGIRVDAIDNDAAIDLASIKMNNLLNLLRLLIPLDYRITSRPRISYYDIHTIDEAYIVDLSNGRRQLHQRCKSLMMPYLPSITRYNVKRAIEEAGEICKKKPKSRSTIETSILRAINWAGEGIDALENDVKVVKCVIALEVLFSLKEKSKKRQFIDKINTIFDDYNINKIDIKKKAREIYKLRSDIVHKGCRDIPDQLAEWAERFACGCILAVLDHLQNKKSA